MALWVREPAVHLPPMWLEPPGSEVGGVLELREKPKCVFAFDLGASAWLLSWQQIDLHSC